MQCIYHEAMLATCSKIKILASHNPTCTQPVEQQTTPFTTLSQCSQFSQHKQSQSFLIVCTIDEMLQLYTFVAGSFFRSSHGSALGISFHATCCWLLFLIDRHTALLHLKPLPKAICQILSPFLMPFLDSMFDNTYLQWLFNINAWPGNNAADVQISLKQH